MLIVLGDRSLLDIYHRSREWSSSKVKALSLLPSLQCLDNNPYISGGLVVKQVNISPTGVRHSTSLQGIP